MKKFIAIFFLLVYSVTTVGATIHSHYCMGEYVGSSFYHTQDSKCGKCGMKTVKQKGCCKDEHKYIQLKREHNQNIKALEVPNFFAETLVTTTYFFETETTFQKLTKENKTPTHPPPFISSVRLHVLNCVYLI